MALIMDWRHQLKISYLAIALNMASRSSYFLGAILFGLVNSLGFAGACLAQSDPLRDPMSLPQPQSPENPNPTSSDELSSPSLTPQSPTFRQEDLPPRTYDPPVYQERDSKVFRTYQLDIGDGISIIVQDFPEFSFAGVIGSDGNIFVPILGKVPVIGLTIEEVETKIAYELGRLFLKEEPEVIASLSTPRPIQLTLLGEIGRPGFYTLPSGTSIVSILLSAGGATPKADLRSIIVRRPLLDGTILEEKVDLYTPLLKGQKVPEVLLQGGDTVIVSKMEFGQEQGYDRGLIARTNLVQPTITVRVLSPNAAASGISLRNITVPTNSTFLDVVASLPSTDPIRVNFDEVALLRFDPEKGRVVSQELNPIGAVQGDLAQNVPLQDQDVIVISRTLLGDILATFRTITQPIRDVFGFSNFILNVPDQIERLGEGGGGRGRFGF
jgi:polysaccharide biosynthesis/export protein